jgi:signal transduction histidine kinase
MAALTTDLKAIIDILPSHIALLDQNGAILAVNRTWKQFGQENALNDNLYCVGRNYVTTCEQAEGDWSEDGLEVAQGIKDVLRGARPTFEFDYPCHSPTEKRWFRLSAVRTEGLGATAVIITHTNVTDRKTAEIAVVDSVHQQEVLTCALLQERARLVAAQSVAKIGSWETDLVTLTMSWSSEMFKIMSVEGINYQPSRQRFLELVHSEDAAAVDDAFERSRETREICTVTHRVTTPAGVTKWLTQRWQTVADANGRAIRAFGTCQDITERVTLENKLRRSERLEALGQLTGGVARDFNNLLTVILGSSEALGDRSDDDAEQKALAEMIATAAERGAELTKRLLAFAQRQTLMSHSIDVNTKIVGMQGLLRRSLPEHIDLKFLPGTSLWPALIDQGQLEVAVLNLAINSRDAMSGGGRLTIATSNTILDEAFCARDDEVTPGKYVVLSVTDSGDGMSAETLARALEPFFTTKEVGGGSGLGLSMVYGFMQQSHGHISIDSEVGHGTTVRLYLPSTQASAPSNDPLPFKTPMGSEVVLLVEDHALVRDYAVLQLRALGYKVVSAKDGVEALQILALRQDIDLLFTDIVMPNEMNGQVLAKKARELVPELPVLFTSGYSESAINQSDYPDGEVHLLAKPYRRAELAAKLRLVLDRARTI